MIINMTSEVTLTKSVPQPRQPQLKDSPLSHQVKLGVWERLPGQRDTNGPRDSISLVLALLIHV